MAAISEYTIARGNNASVTAEYVNSLIMRGWEPYGSPFALSNGEVNQAMIKREC